MAATAASLLALAALLPQALGETVVGSVVFSRHGDRNSKHYPGYRLTPLGQQQNFHVGSGYRERYLLEDSAHRILGISQDQYVPAQIWASAPDQAVLLNTATSFLQGLYPPLDDVNPMLLSTSLVNGSSIESPLQGYQYVVLHGQNIDAPDTIWIKGDDECPVQEAASESFEESEEFLQRMDETRAFYEGFWDDVSSVYNLKPEKMNYGNAYEIFDLINTALIHNVSSPPNVTTEQLSQLRVLADSQQWGLNFNITQPTRSVGGRTLLGGIYNQLESIISSNGKLKFALLAGSYDTFMQVFGLTNLTNVSPDFYGLPEYASTMAFELFTEDNATAFPKASDINVRFLFRNGSQGTLTQFPLFEEKLDSMSWSKFTEEINKVAITKLVDWCELCQSPQGFCVTEGAKVDAAGSAAPGAKQGMSNVVAGVIGAFVTLGVTAILGAIVAFLFYLRHKKNAEAEARGDAETLPSVVEKSSRTSNSISPAGSVSATEGVAPR